MTLDPASSREGGGAAISWNVVSSGVGFLNGWADFGAPYGDVAYALDSTDGLLYFRGAGNPGTDGVAFTLPVGYRPTAQRLAIAFGDGVAQPCEVYTDGTVDFFGNPTASALFDGLVISL